jgi:hypothetical protein
MESPGPVNAMQFSRTVGRVKMERIRIPFCRCCLAAKTSLQHLKN